MTGLTVTREIVPETKATSEIVPPVAVVVAVRVAVPPTSTVAALRLTVHEVHDPLLHARVPPQPFD